MASTLVHNYIHIVFATKYRAPWLVTPYDKELFSYLSQICISNECDVVIVGGHLDHVHILCRFSKKITLSELVKKLKVNSTKWLKTKHHSLRNFSWQIGFAAFSVDRRGISIVKRYIQNQKIHHTKEKYKSEFVRLLKENEVEFDEKYLWD